MKKTLYPLFSALAFFSAAAMLFFTFFTLGWFSDVRGWEWGFELQINTADGAVAFLGDLFWTAAPFGLLLSLFIFLLSGKGTKLSAVLSTLPLTLYALCQILLYFGGKETRLPTWVNLFFILLVAVFTVGNAFFPELENFGTLFPFLLVGGNAFLFLLSLVLQEKLSPFYFSELLPMGHTSYFRYTFILWSILFYYLSYGLSLGFTALAKRNRAAFLLWKEQNHVKKEELNREEPNPEAEEADPAPEESLTLEDLGIER